MQHETTGELWWAACGTGEWVGWSQCIPGETLPPFETRVDEKWEQGGVFLKGKEFPEHSLYRSLNRLRTQKDRSCLCAEKLLPQVHQRCQKFKNSLQQKGQRLLWTCRRWRQGQVPLLCLKVVRFIYYDASNIVGSVLLLCRPMAKNFMLPLKHLMEIFSNHSIYK